MTESVRVTTEMSRVEMRRVEDDNGSSQALWRLWENRRPTAFRSKQQGTIPARRANIDYLFEKSEIKHMATGGTRHGRAGHRTVSLGRCC